MVSATLLRDLICRKENPYAEVFTPERFDVKSLAGVAAESGQAVKGLAKGFLQIPSGHASELPNGHGGVVFLHGRKLGYTRTKPGASIPLIPAARTWAVSWSGIRMSAVETVSAMAPALTALVI